MFQLTENQDDITNSKSNSGKLVDFKMKETLIKKKINSV